MIEHTHPPKLDIRHAAEALLLLTGRDSLSNFERLMHETQGLGGENALTWTARAELRQDDAGQAQHWLHLTVLVSLPLICQRCLGPVDVEVQVDQAFRFVESEAAAEQQDETSDEDVLVLSREFDLAGLIEDEVLMALPLVPRHDACPVAVKLLAADADFDAGSDKPNPFAVLARLKDKNGD